MTNEPVRTDPLLIEMVQFPLDSKPPSSQSVVTVTYTVVPGHSALAVFPPPSVKEIRGSYCARAIGTQIAANATRNAARQFKFNLQQTAATNSEDNFSINFPLSFPIG
jgi:hypothetical protein